MKRKNIITNNREIYEKFTMLNFSNEIILNNVKSVQLNKILKSVNKHNKILTLEKLGSKFLVKKLSPVNFNIYLQKKYIYK